MKKKTIKELTDECARLTEQLEDKKDRENKQKRVIEELYTLRPLSFTEKLVMALAIYGDVRIKQKGETVTLEHSIQNGWCSFQSPTVEEGLDKMLFLK